MALNIHTDPQFEKQLTWLCRQLKKTKTDVVKNLVATHYEAKRQGLRFGALKRRGKTLSSGLIQRQLKALDQDHDFSGF